MIFHIAVNGDWSQWSSWSECTRSCGVGSMKRHRSCTNPQPQYGGLDCPVDDDGYGALRNQSCNEHNCSGLNLIYISR